MSEQQLLLATQRLAGMVRALRAGQTMVLLADGKREHFRSIDELKGMVNAMRDQTKGMRVLFRPRAPAGSANEMPVAYIDLPQAVDAALNGVGAIVNSDGRPLVVAAQGKNPPTFRRDLRTR